MERLRPRRRRRQTLVALLAVVALALFASMALAATANVDVQDNTFVPAEVTITEGDTVEWTQSGSNPHTVTADDGSFDSHPDCNSFADGTAGNCMSNGDTYSEDFNEAGEFPYYCKIHGGPGGQGMSGVITVQAADDGDAGEEEPEPEPEDEPEEEPEAEPEDEPAADEDAEEEEELPNTGPAANLVVLGLAGLGLVGFGLYLLRRRPAED